MIRIFIILFFSALLFFGCNEKENTPKTEQTQQSHSISGDLSGVVTEVLQTPSYTYIKLKDNVEEKWIAVTQREMEIGQTLYYEQGMEMKNFESKTLNRTFPSIWFVSKAAFTKTYAPNSAVPVQSPHKKNMRKSSAQASVTIDKKNDEISIADLYKNPAGFEGKVIKIKGQVTKFNANILNKNWVHIQDGTEFNGKYDLTITTNETTQISDIVTFEGKITLNKDFGAGYKYAVIMEQAVIK